MIEETERELRVSLAKTCKFLVPATKNVKRPHCDMGDGREGDCPIYIGKTNKCQFTERRVS